MSSAVGRLPLFPTLLLSALVAGPIATAVMLGVLYLPRLWGGTGFDVLGALGSAITKELDARARGIGAIMYFAGGVLFAFFYGWIAWMLLSSAEGTRIPLVPLSVGPTDGVNLFYPLLGLHMGLAHGLIVFLFGAVVILEHHPIERFRTRYSLIASQIFSHLVYGAVVMFFLHLFLQMGMDA